MQCLQPLAAGWTILQIPSNFVFNNLINMTLIKKNHWLSTTKNTNPMNLPPPTFQFMILCWRQAWFNWVTQRKNMKVWEGVSFLYKRMAETKVDSLGRQIGMHFLEWQQLYFNFILLGSVWKGSTYNKLTLVEKFVVRSRRQAIV